MARYRGTVQGNRTEASRLGTAKSGLRVTANGWDIGARVELSASTDERDYVTIYLTAGSNGSQSSIRIGQYTRADLDAMQNDACDLPGCNGAHAPGSSRNHAPRREGSIETA